MQLKNTLLPFQIKGVDKLKQVKVGALFMEQGTGKTITALELCHLRLEAGKVEHIVWLCPCSAKQNIKAELLKHASEEMLECITICGIETLSSSVKANVYLCSLVTERKCFLVVDESLLTKNPGAYRTKNIIKLSEKCQYKLILNGTPISRNEADLFTQFYILDWRILGYRTFWSFAANHLEYDPDNPNRVVRCLNTDYLARKIEPYVFQIRKNECIQLPNKNYSSRYYYLTEQQREHYDEIADDLLFDLDELRPETIYRLFTALQAIACGRRVIYKKINNYTHIQSVPFFENPKNNLRLQILLNEVEKDEKAIIFCTYQDDITVICSILNHEYGLGSAVRFDGSITFKQREKNLALFENSCTWLVANRNCAGYSLNLQFCHKIIYYSNSWDLATRLQSEDRVHRIGQEHDITIVDIYANATIDERIFKCLSRKEGLLESFKEQVKRGKNREALKNWLDVDKKRVRSAIYDCSDLEESDAENI